MAAATQMLMDMGQRTTWDSANQGPGCTLSGGNFIASFGGGGGGNSVINNLGKSSGKGFAEITYISGTAHAVIGFGLATVDVFNPPGATTGTVGYRQNGDAAQAPSFFAGYGSSYVAGDVIGITWDGTAGALNFYKNGVAQGNVFGVLSGTGFLMVGFNGVGSPSFLLNAGSFPFAYGPPAGYPPGWF